MTHDSRTMTPPQGWDRYWREAAGGGAYCSEGEDHPLLAAFWREVLASQHRPEPARIVDIACGNGSLEQAFRSAGVPAGTSLFAFDLSPAAVGAVARRFAPVLAFVADARAVPLPAAAFALVASQFGIEYAGDTAVAEALRLVAPGGTLALLIHNRDGSIYRDCAANLEAVEALLRTELAPLAIEVLSSLRPAAGPAAATTRLVPALRAVESILQKHGPRAAGGAVIRFYNDVARLCRDQLGADERRAAVDWLRGMNAEFSAYSERMASMSAAALSGEAFSALCGAIGRAGLQVTRAGPLAPQGALPLAWAVIASRPAA